METEFLTLKEASEFLKIGVATLNRWMREGKIPSYKIGGRRLFDKTELIECVKNNRSFFGTRGRLMRTDNLEEEFEKIPFRANKDATENSSLDSTRT